MRLKRKMISAYLKMYGHQFKADAKYHKSYRPVSGALGIKS